MANESNLIPLNKRTKSAQRKIQSKGGIAKAKKVKETKELIQISMFLHNFIDSQQADVKKGLEKIVQKGGRDLLSLIKEAREATEGNKIHQTGATTQVVVSDKKLVKEVIKKLWD